MEGLTTRQAARFLDMATMGVKPQELEDLLSLDDRQAWISEQVSIDYQRHVERTQYQQQQRGEAQASQDMRVCAWFDIALWGSAQLRQRVAFALSQILVVSDKDANLAAHPLALAHYYDLLSEHAFSDYKSLLYHVSRSPVMGHYLTFVGNLSKQASGVDPDQNYAREVMQLFSIGLYRLNPDGSQQLDGNGKPIPSYDDNDIEALSRTFTGWFADGDSMTAPMVAHDAWHDMGEKQVLGKMVSANLGADEELDVVLEILLDHPNTAPNISRLLIQRLVSSNPRPAYVQRVAEVFTNTRGDLEAVVRAILTDPETLLEHDLHVAKLREPILALCYVYRALEAFPKGGGDIVYNSMNYTESCQQYPLGADSVFNFYQPDDSPQGDLADNGLAAPEFKIVNWSQSIKLSNVFYKLARTYGQDRNKSNSKTELYIAPLELENAIEEWRLADAFQLLAATFLNGEMSSQLTERLQAICEAHSENRRQDAVWKIIFFTVFSPEFMVME
ncbi:DUF1800 domain-containing protein [Aliagarivorans marinus]|uniref:DUF1800 domain-containing protein n=1 Tax=Aliagarivorans marinus TaxID=561965 RepID=UPI00040ADC92|nr:DUF1800 family protein [Aliagarivorans marinus]